LDSFPASILYLLAAPSTPEAARIEIIERAEAGEAISHAEVKKVIKKTRAKSAGSSTRCPPLPDRNDIGPTSTGEVALLRVRIGELENAKRRLEIESTRLRSEIAELRSHLKPSDRNDHIAVLACKITALMSHPVHHTDAIYKAAAEILHIAKPEAKNGKPIAISPTNETLDTAAFRRAMALPASEAQR
jgi:hypothetical protein